MKTRIVICILLPLLLANTSYPQDTLALEPASQLYGSGIATIDNNVLAVYDAFPEQDCSYIRVVDISNPHEPEILDSFAGISLPGSNERMIYTGQITGVILFDDAIFWCTMEDYHGWNPSTYGPINLKGRLFESDDGWRWTRELHERGPSPIYYPGNMARYEDYLIVAGGEQGIIIFDLSDPENPEQVSILRTVHNLVITVQDRLCIYTGPDRNRLIIYNISNPEQLENTGSYLIDYAGCPYQIQTDPVIYNDCLVLKNNSDLEHPSSLLLMDVTSDDPLDGEMIDLDREYGPYRFYISDDRLYVHPSGENYVDVYDIDDNLEVAHAATLLPSQMPGGHFIVHDNKLLFTGGGTYIYDISPVSVSTSPTLHPASFTMYAYPNPFNGMASFVVNMPVSANISMSAYDLSGREVGIIKSGFYAAGSHQLIWNAGSLSAGVYLVCFKAGDFTQTSKLSLMR